MKYQITENEENIFLGGKIAQVSVVTLRPLNLTTLLHRRQIYDQIQIFKIISGVEDVDVDSFFTFIDNNTRGYMFRIAKPSVNKSLRLSYFPVRAIDSWNSLSEYHC